MLKVGVLCIDIFFVPLFELEHIAGIIAQLQSHYAQTVVHFAHFQVQVGKKGCFRVGLGVFCVRKYLRKGSLSVIMAVTSIGATAPGLVVPVPWAACQSQAAIAGAHSAGHPLHVSLAPCALPGADATGQTLQSVAQSSQPGAALWSTIPSIASQICGPSPSAGLPNSADAARAAMFLSQLAALKPQAQAAAQPLLITPPLRT